MTKSKSSKKYNFSDKHPLYEVLNNVIDPEIEIGIADMGLIYDATVSKNGLCEVVMSLTSMGCPFGAQIVEDIEGILKKEKEIKNVNIDIVWDPPWNPDMMKEGLREMLLGG